MSRAVGYVPGGDAQAIRTVAEGYFGSYANLFKAHGWPETGAALMTSAPRRIVEAYGSIRSFEDTYRAGDHMFPMEAIMTPVPNVWLTSFYGFKPEEWGFLGFTKPDARQSFIEETRPGVLVVIYAAGKADPGERGKVVGIQQCSHRHGSAEQFMSPLSWRLKEADPDRASKWMNAVKATRAWRVTPESRPLVQDFAPEATRTGAWQHIGAYGVRLSRREALNILSLGLQEVSVYGENPITDSLPGDARSILAPSKAGPVSQKAFLTQESEGPKHLYILVLKGDTDAFMGGATGGKLIVKAGFSKSPVTRRDDHNRALPQCAFHWAILNSGATSGLDPYPTSDHAKAGERAMQQVLCSAGGRSLGGEFFLAERELIDRAWENGNQAARDHKK